MEILKTADGSHTIRHSSLGELYHSDRGAVGEALHVYIEAGFKYGVEINHATKISVFEMGFGSGLNAWLTLKASEELGIYVDYHAVEMFPVPFEIAEQLNFTTDIEFLELHRSRWNDRIDITNNFTLTKHSCDITKFDFTPFTETFNIVYFDAFAPDIQMEIWETEVFSKIYSAMTHNGVLTTYTAKGSVKNALRSSGFAIERLRGALGKRHMLRARK